MSNFVSAWVAQEKPAFQGFNEFISTRMTESVTRTICETLKRQMLSNHKAELEMPWGVFSAEVKTVGEGTNITPTFEPSKRFLEMLNADDNKRTADFQENFDDEFVKLFRDYLAWGVYDPDEKNAPAKEKGARIDPEEVEYFLDSFMRLMVSLARDHQRDGKEYYLDINAEFDHGRYTFEYVGDDIKVKFTPSKAFKQYLKNDAVSEAE
ncbi:MAG: hypothetical protein NC114_06360 [Ruminococcus flavefaciens]|nr:hypothetical protein [Ruminococcus flavefaciens]